MHVLLRRTAVALSLVFAAAAVHADEVQDINRMMRQGQLPQSLERIDKFLAGKPRDAQGRFLKGLILTEMNRPAEAIQVFAKLAEDYPELPEPYNNLAVLYASQGQYEKARVALESSIRTHPSYATAHENLGDIYAKLASQAYDKALQLDSSNTGAKTKLAMIGELIGGGTRVTRAAARPEPAKAPEMVVAKSADAGKAGAPSAAAKSGTEPKAPEPKAAGPKATEPAAKASASQDSQTDEILKSVHAWANAWAKKDVSGYLAHYAKDFKTPKGEARGDWEKGRKQRISAPKKIEIGIEAPKVSMSSDSTANVGFRQIYHSDVIKTSGTKTLVMVKANGKWLIREERVN
jgi:tetratricopeptide (TPR) repeat protein